MVSIAARPAETARDADGDWQYDIVLAHPLPVIDLSVSVLSVLAGSETNDVFFATMRRHYGKFVVLFRLGTVLMAVTLLTPASLGHIFVILIPCFSLGSMIFSVLMMSWQLLLFATTMQEIVFMTTMNWINWAGMAMLIRDVRLIVCCLLGLAFQLMILSDVMFRTVLSASKSAILAQPLLMTCVLGIFFHALDVDERNYASIHVNNIDLPIADIVLNVSLTLMLLVSRNIYRQRRAFGSTENRLILCTMLKTKLMLRPRGHASPTPLTAVRGDTSRGGQTVPLQVDVAPSPAPTRGATPVEAIRLVAVQASKKRIRTSISHLTSSLTQFMPIASYRRRNARIRQVCDPTKPHMQQLRLVPTHLKIVDSRHTLVPRLTPQHKWPFVWIRLLQATGLTGLVLMLAESISLDKPPHDDQFIHTIVSFLTSSVFVLSSVGAMQTTLLRALGRTFDVWMNVCQLLTGSVCLCAMVHWDQRCLVAATICLWFAWILTFDALTPRMRRRMGLTKRHAGVALLGVMASLLRIVASLTFDEHNAYVDSEIGSFGIREGVRVEMRTKSFFLNRMFPLTVWAVRLLWELLWCDETELVFLKGSLEYFCPMEMLPLKKSPTPEQVATV